jgi:SAM-dependent methyltransferase
MPNVAGPDKRDAWRDARVAAEYEARRFGTPLRRLKHRHDEELVLALLARAGGAGSVLDLPCGTGRLFPALVADGRRVTGADIALEMLRAGRAARPAAGVALLQSDALHLPFRDAAFDAVVSQRFLFHLERPERVAVLRELARVARLAVIGQVRLRGNAKHLGRYLRSRVGLAARYRPAGGRAQLLAELSEAGLELVELRPVSRLFSDKALFLARPRPRV